jgi:hypothetical protein
MTPQRPARGLAIKRAATIVGGLGQLAQRLSLPERQLDYWVRDIGTPPDSVFFDVIDIIIESAGARRSELVEPGWRERQARHRNPFFK